MPKYTNAIKNKQCPLCSTWFKGDETIKGELCYQCDMNAIECEKCGDQFIPNEDKNVCPACEDNEEVNGTLVF